MKAMQLNHDGITYLFDPSGRTLTLVFPDLRRLSLSFEEVYSIADMSLYSPDKEICWEGSDKDFYFQTSQFPYFAGIIEKNRMLNRLSRSSPQQVFEERRPNIQNNQTPPKEQAGVFNLEKFWVSSIARYIARRSASIQKNETTPVERPSSDSKESAWSPVVSDQNLGQVKQKPSLNSNAVIKDPECEMQVGHLGRDGISKKLRSYRKDGSFDMENNIGTEIRTYS